MKRSCLVFVPKMENPNDFDWYLDDAFAKISELPPLESLLEPDHCLEQRQQENVLDISNVDLTGFTHLAGSSDEAIGVDMRSHHNYFTGSDCMFNEVSMVVFRGDGNEETRMVSGRKKSVPLELAEIKKFFNMPIIRAAKEMNVGLTVLKRRCRELNIMRWPHRKIKSLNSLMNNVKELGLKEEMVLLEEHKRLLQNVPDTELTERTKRLRQACFKAKYKRRRILAG